LQKSKNHVDIFRKRVFLAFSPQRGWKNSFWHSHRAQESNKNMLPTEHGDHISGICNPSSARTSELQRTPYMHRRKKWLCEQAKFAIFH
jgi:hypothetical protein